jgi:hypothetical protein
MVRMMLVILALVVTGCASDVPHPFPTMPQDDALQESLPAALLWAHPYPDLLVEIDYVEGREPSTLALDALRDTLRGVTDKAEIVIAPPTLLPASDSRFQGGREWTREELADVHKAYFQARASDAFGDEGTARVHVLYLNGRYPTGSTFHGTLPTSALGLQIRDALLMFPDDLPTAQDEERPWGTLYERSTLIHELGHAMGLVNHGIPMQRPHVAEDGVHSSNPRSVMAQGHRGPWVLEEVQDGEWIPYRFDADDLADLAAFRETGRASAPR